MNSEIELVNGQKVGLTLRNPIMVASGYGGYGTELARWGDLSLLGGAITGPVSPRPWPGADQPRLCEVAGGYLLHTGNQNPGVRRVLRDHAKTWAASGATVIVRVCGSCVEDYAAVVARLEGVEGVSGFELDVTSPDATDDDLGASLDVIRAVREATILPVLAVVPLFGPRDLPIWCIEEGADALVVASPSRGQCAVGAELLRGQLFAPALRPLVEYRVAQVAEQVEASVVARGGIHSARDVLAYLSAGARAVQVDSAIVRDPTVPWRILAELGGSLSSAESEGAGTA